MIQEARLFSTRAVSVAGQFVLGTRSRRLLILIYHRVHERPDSMFPGQVDAERFDWQMNLIKRYCHPMALIEGVAALRKGKLPHRAVAVTFDDGYADNATVALQILKRHGLSATFFVSTGFLDGGCMWNDVVIESLRESRQSSIDLSELGLGIVSLGSPVQRGELAERVLRAVKHRPPVHRMAWVDDLAVRLRVSPPTTLMMTTKQVRQLSGAGMEVGAHTVSHPILKVLRPNEAAAEIAQSAKVLEAVTNRPVRSFAYPNGRLGDDYTERDRDLVASIGFDHAVATNPGVATAASDTLQLPRFTPWDRTPSRWLARLLLAYNRLG